MLGILRPPTRLGTFGFTSYNVAHVPYPRGCSPIFLWLSRAPQSLFIVLQIYETP